MELTRARPFSTTSLIDVGLPRLFNGCVTVAARPSSDLADADTAANKKRAVANNIANVMWVGTEKWDEGRRVKERRVEVVSVGAWAGLGVSLGTKLYLHTRQSTPHELT